MKLVVLDSTAIPGISRGPGSPAYFSRFAVEHLRKQGHDVTILDGFDRDICSEADAVWAEWCNEDAFAAAASGVCKKLIVRVRGFDVWNPIERLQRENVDAFVCESPFVQDLLVKEHPAVTWKSLPLVLPSGIDVGAAPFRERKHGPVVALVARAIADKGYQLAFEWARQRPDVNLHVACALGNTLQSTRLMRYLQHTKPHNVTIYPAVDTVKWLDEIGANYLLSASVWETLGYTIVEAMALGIKPFIHDTPGAELNWGPGHLWRSFGDLNRVESTGSYNSHAYRWVVEDQFDAAKRSPRFAELVLAPSTREAPVRPTVQPSVVEAPTSLGDVPIPTAPTRLDFLSPLRGGPLLVRIRDHLSPHGRVRFSGTRARTFVDFTPGAPEPRVLALDTIVRSDAAGLERMLLSVLPYVDEIVLGVDARSDAETVAVARAFADRVHTFDAAAIGLDEAAWAAGKIDFAAARNLGRAMVQSPWTLVVDSDEYIGEADELRPLLQADGSGNGVAFSPRVCIEVDGAIKFEQRDFQRLARTEYRWHQAAHNQLKVPPGAIPPYDVNFQIVSDTSLRTAEERARRDGQRELGIDGLIAEAMAGNLNALFHVAKHKAVRGTLAEGAAIVEKFRLSIEPNGPGAYQRQWVALAMAIRYYQEDDSQEANRWACRALLDGPSLNAFCLLGDLAEEDGDLPRARSWYEAACAMPVDGPIAWPEHVNRRMGRLAGIRRALAAVPKPLPE